jgi:hypothetical protein
VCVLECSRHLKSNMAGRQQQQLLLILLLPILLLPPPPLAARETTGLIAVIDRGDDLLDGIGFDLAKAMA